MWARRGVGEGIDLLLLLPLLLLKDLPRLVIIAATINHSGYRWRLRGAAVVAAPGLRRHTVNQHVVVKGSTPKGVPCDDVDLSLST